jgi:alpha-L-rhamnosidase
VDPPPPPPSPLLRKSFTLDKPIRSATVSICGLGYYELRMNGRRVGDHVLDPAFTRYDRRALYVTYDVTELVRQGRNAVGVQLGNGWYNEFSRSAWNFDHAPWRDLPKLLCQLDVVLADGTRTSIASNGEWKTSSEGPTRFDGIRHGESYDARHEIPGWDTPEFNDQAWLPARLARAPGGVLAAQMLPPIRVTKTLRPVSLSEPRPGVWVFDLGQNIAGWARLNVRGPAGTQLVLRYGERLASDGTLDQQAIAEHVYEGQFQTDRYTLRGGGPEQWEPKFVYHGFQYVEVTGLPERPTQDTLSGRVVHTDFESVGHFTCSNELVNRIEQNAVWSYLGNFHGYPTDCPHREKNGWTGDAHLAVDMGLLHFRGEAAYTKWMTDIADEQQPGGPVAAIIPTSGWGYLWGNGPAWDSAYLLIPYAMYQYRGDRRIFERLYDGWRRYVDYLTSKADQGIVSIGLGDWCPAKTKTPVEVTSTAYYYVDTRIVAHAATLLGKQADAERYTRQAETIRQAFLTRFYDRATGRVANGSQTAQACALCQGLAGPAETPKILDRLVDAVDAADGHLDAGILGTKYLLHALSEHGRADVAWRVVTQTTPPGWGHWIEQGATTLWEQWSGGASRNHIMFGDVSAWFIKYLGGIGPGAPGFRQIVIRPQPLGDLRWARAEHLCPYGWIRTDWRIDAGRFTLDLTVPVGTTATVYVPAQKADAVTEGSMPAARAAGVRLLRFAEGAAVFAVGSGRYRFAAPCAAK